MIERLDIHGLQVTVTPIPAIPMLKIAHRVGQAVARERALTAVVSDMQTIDKDAFAKLAQAGEGVDDSQAKIILTFVERLFTIIDTAMLDDLLREAGKVISINGVTGAAALSMFDGDLQGLALCLYNVLRVSGFFGTLRVSP